MWRGASAEGIDQWCCGPLHLPCMCNDPNYPSKLPPPPPKLPNKHSSERQAGGHKGHCDEPTPPPPLSAKWSPLHSSHLLFPNQCMDALGYLIINPLFPTTPSCPPTSSPGWHRKAFVRWSCDHILQYADTELLKPSHSVYMMLGKTKKLKTEVDVNRIRW